MHTQLMFAVHVQRRAHAGAGRAQRRRGCLPPSQQQHIRSSTAALLVHVANCGVFWPSTITQPPILTRRDLSV
jgi:hypothetical protein